MQQLKKFKQWAKTQNLWDAYNAMPLVLVAALGLFKTLGWI